jgi:hypothetical protein
MGRPRHRLGSLVLCGVLATGCGWHAGLPSGTGQSVGVEVFGATRNVLERDLEPRLHDALSRSVSDHLRAPLAAADRADLVVRGEIHEYRRRSGVRDRDNRLLESGVRISLRAVLVDRRRGVELRSVERNVWSGYIIGPEETELEARDRALRHLADTIVLDLFHGETLAPGEAPAPGAPRAQGPGG